MGGQGKGDGRGSGAMKLESQIYCIKYTLFCFNVVLWMFGAAIFALCIWIAIEPGFNQWITDLELQKFFIGIYFLMFSAIIIMIVSFLGCGAALMEHVRFLWVFLITQVVLFVIGMIGTAVLLDFSTYESSIQPIIHEVIIRFMNNPQHEFSRRTLNSIQEAVGCCGASGPNDYMNLRKPLPAECRDAVTGNAFFHGCVDELTWFLEEKTGWLAGIAMAACMMHVINAVMSLVLIQAVKKDEEENSPIKD